MIQYLLGWSEVSDIAGDFEIPLSALEPYDVLLGYYSYKNWSGEAFVLLKHKQTSELFEVNGSHCSCYGLERQWEPEETSLEALYHRMSEGKLGDSWNGPGYKKELQSVLDYLHMVDTYPTYDEALDQLVKMAGQNHEILKDKKQALSLINEMLTDMNNENTSGYFNYRDCYAAMLRKDFNGNI